MIQVYRFDKDGYYVEPVLVDSEIPKDCTPIRPPQPNWKPRFVDGSWVETVTYEELQEIKNTQRPKSELEILRETVDTLVLESLKGV